VTDVFVAPTQAWQEIFDRAPDAMVVVNAEGRILLVNRQTEALFVYAREELIGLRVEALIPGRFHAVHARHRARYVTSPRPRPMGADLELLARRKNGEEFPVEISLSYAQTEQGLLVMSAIRDVTARRRIEREVADAARRMRVTLDTMRDALTLTDEQGRVVLSNPAYHQVFTLDRDPTVLARLPAERDALLAFADASGRPLREEEMPATRALEGHIVSGAQALDLHARALDGRELDVSVTAAPVRDGHGHIVGAVTVYRDITSRRQLERELERERETMMELLAHDFRHPFTIVQMAYELMRKELDRGRAAWRSNLRELLDYAGRAESQLERMFSDFREVVLINAGELEMERAPTDLAALAREVASSGARTADRAVSIEVPKRPVMAHVDRDRIEQVLSNLLRNAFKYSPPEAAVRVRLRRRRSPDQTQTCIEVRDAGPGVPKQKQAHLFERFYRVQETRAQPGAERGLGLGLFICQYLVQRHGGQIGVRSREGHGATFWFTLPLLEQADARAVQASPA
jgi:PAS domain S-box-containing protein